MAPSLTDIDALPVLLRRLRKRSGYTQRQLGKLLGVSHAHISAVESPHREASLSVPLLIRWLTECGAGLEVRDASAGEADTLMALAVDADGQAFFSEAVRAYNAMDQHHRMVLISTFRALIASLADDD